MTPVPAAARAGGVAAASEEIVVLDYGGQYSQLIARRVRDCGVFSELLPHGVSTDELAARGPRGIILSGGPASVYAEGAPRLDRRLLELGIPVLGICYGMQLLGLAEGARVHQHLPDDRPGKQEHRHDEHNIDAAQDQQTDDERHVGAVQHRKDYRVRAQARSEHRKPPPRH